MRNLTDKQEKFVELVVGGMPQSDAYRQVYNTKAKPKVVARKASEELKKPHVNMRYQYLLDKARAQAAAGSVLNVNPVLVLGWLEQQHGLPAASGDILRTGIYTRNGEKFS